VRFSTVASTSARQVRVRHGTLTWRRDDLGEFAAERLPGESAQPVPAGCVRARAVTAQIRGKRRQIPSAYLWYRDLGGSIKKTMKTAPALALIAIGAILAFAVHAHPRFFSFQIAGWVIMLTGIAGLVIPRRNHRWVRRVTSRAGATARTGRDRDLPINQAFRRRLSPAVMPSPRPDPPAEEADGTGPTPNLPKETVEEFYEE
jgi:hypothetical protein